MGVNDHGFGTYSEGAAAAGAPRADSRDADEYGMQNADRLARQAAESPSVGAWRAVRAIAADVREHLPSHNYTRPSGPPRPHVARLLKRAEKRIAAVYPRLDEDGRRYATVLAREIREALAA